MTIAPLLDAVRAAGAPPTPATPGPKTRLNIVLFSGGTGTHSITAALARHPQVALTILINAYDDGHSTGRLRKFIPGMLGPSDVRKNIGRLMKTGDDCHRALAEFSDHRLPVGIDFAPAMALVRAIARHDRLNMEPKVWALFERLTVKQAAWAGRFCHLFEEYTWKRLKEGVRFDFTDCALGNLLFAGCYLENAKDFNRTVQAFGECYEIGATLLNVTHGENLFLVAVKEDGTVLPSEADIVSAANTRSKIAEILLIGEDVYRAEIEANPALTPGRLKEISRQQSAPELNPEARDRIRSADIIVYGPGTQHSSLFPSYLTRGVSEAILDNRGADKVFIANIRRDHDIQQDDANDLARKFLGALSRGGHAPAEWKDVVTHFFFQKLEGDSGGAYIPFNESTFPFPMDTVHLRDWEFQEGKHAGGYVFQQLEQIVQSRMAIALEPHHDLVSIVVPVLNEERTVEAVLQELTALDFQNFGLSKEILLVDGGSTDRTLELARSVRGVKILQLNGVSGRGAALRRGLEQARGDLILFYPADGEYRATDLYNVAGSILGHRYPVVFGTRAIKTSLEDRLRQVYGGGVAYTLSKYGGMLLSMLTLLLYNRYLSDTLTGVKGFDAKALRDLDLKGTGPDLDLELVAKLSRANRYILEIPVDFKPRTRAEGKKTTIADGFRAVWALLRYRF